MITGESWLHSYYLDELEIPMEINFHASFCDEISNDSIMYRDLVRIFANFI